MSEKKKIYKPKPISGFPEWTPAARRVEQQWMDIIRETFESYGFCNIETPAVEELDVITAKGETDKEIYTLARLQADENDKSDARLGLHFDLTVPFARYTAQNFNELAFPFKRYQMQKVWRGERPQQGRMREFYQCDIDVINPDNLPLYFDAEMPAIMSEILTKLDIGEFEILLSNRKILDGYLTGLGITDKKQMAMRMLDKHDKLGTNGVIAELEKLGIVNDIAQKAVALASIKTNDTSFVAKVRAIGVNNETLDEGLNELETIMSMVASMIKGGSVMADLSIVRGFDYYTGTVYETRLKDYPQIGSIVSGGRYDDLAGTYINKKLPGVGISFGLTRLFSVLLNDGKITNTRISPADVLVALPSEEQRSVALETARTLRENGHKVEVYHAPQKIGKQISYAEKKGIPFVWFPPFDTDGSHEIKNLATGEQTSCEPENWTK